MKIRMRSFGLVAMLVLAGCTKPEPQPQPQPQPEPLPEPQSESLTQAPQPVSVELKAGAATASNDACKTLAQSIGLTEQRRDELRRQIEGEAPLFGVDNRSAADNRSLDVNPVYLNLKMALSTAEVDLVELRARRSSQQCDDPTARLQTCKLPEELQSRIESYGKQLEALRLKYTDGHPDVVSLKESLNALVQQGLNECVEQIQKDSPGHI